MDAEVVRYVAAAAPPVAVAADSYPAAPAGPRRPRRPPGR